MVTVGSIKCICQLLQAIVNAVVGLRGCFTFIMHQITSNVDFLNVILLEHGQREALVTFLSLLMTWQMSESVCAEVFILVVIC